MTESQPEVPPSRRPVPLRDAPLPNAHPDSQAGAHPVVQAGAQVEDSASRPIVARVVAADRSASDRAPAEPLGRFGHNRVGILATLFLVSGIVGLPLLLLSPAFSRPEKGFWTVAIIIYTAVVFSLFGGFLLWVWKQIGG